MTDSSELIEISLATFERLRLIAEEDRTSIGAVVDVAVKDMERKRFWERFTRSWEAIRADPEASAAIDAEVAIWECTLMDGLEGEPREPGACGEEPVPAMNSSDGRARNGAGGGPKRPRANVR